MRIRDFDLQAPGNRSVGIFLRRLISVADVNLELQTVALKKFNVALFSLDLIKSDSASIFPKVLVRINLRAFFRFN